MKDEKHTVNNEWCLETIEELSHMVKKIIREVV
jgi:hypothetical protein